MPAELVKIVNANGRVGWVADTYPPYVSGALRRAPSEADDTSVPATVAGLVTPDTEEAKPAEADEDLPPAKNATKAAWVDYATNRHGLDVAEAEDMTRDELVDYFTPEEN
jgi:hypothetical protein